MEMLYLFVIDFLILGLGILALKIPLVGLIGITMGLTITLPEAINTIDGTYRLFTIIVILASVLLFIISWKGK